MSESLGIVAAALIVVVATAGTAHADACSGRTHTKGTALGAAGGGLIGGLASNGSAGGIIGGAVVGGLAGNAIARRNDCANQPRGYYHNGRYYEHRRRDSEGRYHYW